MLHLLSTMIDEEARHGPEITVPLEVSTADLTFGGSMKRLLPGWDDIPDEFKFGKTVENEFFSDLFFSGVKNQEFTPREGINTSKALKHVMAIARSFEPAHEHKEAACAYLLNKWFEDITWERGDPEE